MTIEDFKAAAKAKKVAAGSRLRKQFIADDIRAGKLDSRELTFTISTATVDREGDTIATDGWDFENYMRNPVVLWAHDYRGFPIASTRDISVKRGKVKAVAKFLDPNIPIAGERAEAVYQMYLDGDLRATSVGFIPREFDFSKDEGRPFGIDFETQELLEFSAVPVPANPEALIDARALKTGEPDVPVLMIEPGRYIVRATKERRDDLMRLADLAWHEHKIQFIVLEELEEGQLLTEELAEKIIRDYMFGKGQFVMLDPVMKRGLIGRGHPGETAKELPVPKPSEEQKTKMRLRLNLEKLRSTAGEGQRK